MTHELSLMNNLVNKIQDIARAENAKKVSKVKVRLGALSHTSADHFLGHFLDGIKGTVAEDAELEIEVSDDVNDPNAQDILLVSVDVRGKSE